MPVATKPESQEICFIPENNYRNFLKNNGVSFQKGYIRNQQGAILAEHEGKENYTIGQRKGLGIAAKQPLYVLDILPDGDVIVGEKKELDCKLFYCKDTIFQGLDPKHLHQEGIEVKAQIRYNSPPVSAVIFKEEAKSDITLRVEARSNCSAVASGQTVVFYDPNEGCILAGGKIE